jgi:MinD-like ATPase involved in chromosome partitioning or flagellar assembly
MARSVWADMLISGPDEDAPGWPSSGLPPSFGQRPVAGERPDFEDAGYGAVDPDPPEPGPAGYGVVAPSPPEPGPAWYGAVEPGPPEPGPAGYGVVDPPDMAQVRDWEGTEAAFGPWGTYETGTTYESAVGYGAVPAQEPAGRNNGVAEVDGRPAADGRSHGSYGVVPPAAEPSPGYVAEPPPGYVAEPSPGYVAEPPPGYVAEPPPGYVAEPPPGYVAEPSPGYPEPAGYPEEPTWQGVSADSLSADVPLPGRHAAPPAGWRRTLYQITGGRVRAPQSTADRRHMDLALRARTPVAGGHHRVAVLSLKGGVGKTTTTVGLGSTLASLRGDRVIAIDANPDRGTLCDKLRLETAATVRDLLNEGGQIRRYADVRAYTTQAPSGLEILASDRDPTVSVAFSDEDYMDVAQVLEHYYSICITDCGTGLLHSAMAGVLHLADQIVLVSSPSVDGARSASATLDWLAAHRYGDLVRGAVVVLSAIRPRSKSTVDLGGLEQHFAARCRAVVRVPYDAHLEEGAEIDLDQLSRATTDAYLVLAAAVGDGFAWSRR